MEKFIIATGIVLAGFALYANKKNYICPIDGAVFKSQAELDAHYIEQHPGERVPIKISWK